MENPGLITEKVHDLILKYGVRSDTKNDIANELGISKKTIYKFLEAKMS